MKRLFFLFGLFAVFAATKEKSVAASKVKPEMWTVKNGSDFVFLANATLQLHTTYTLSNGSSSQATISFTTEKYNVSSASNTNTSIAIKIANTTMMQSLEMTFSNDGKDYWMTALTVKFYMDSKTFPNAKNANKTVSTTMQTAKKVFLTKLNQSYKCSLDTELQLQANDSVTTWFNMGGLQLEAFRNSVNFSTASKCFADQPQSAVKSTWNFLKDKTTCARIYAKAYVDVSYAQISGKMIKTRIPIPENTTTSATCNKKKIKGTISLDGSDVQLKLEFDLLAGKKKIQKSYVLGSVSLVYASSNKFFPNAPSSAGAITISNTSLSVHSTPVEESYLCSVDEDLAVTGNMTLMLSDTQWQAFGTLPDKGFAKASECEAMKTTPTPPVTTPHPDPLVPTVYKWEASDGNRTCFLAMAGFQFRAIYTKTGEQNATQVWFDFNNETSKISSTDCSKDSISVTIENWGNMTSRNQSILLTFSKYEKMTKYALAGVKIMFQVNNVTFINATSLNQTVEANSDSNIVLMSNNLNQTYSCSMETQVKVDGNETAANISNIFLRIYNVTELEPFLVNGKLSKTKKKCFRDEETPPSTQGNWKILNKNNKTCARIQSEFTLDVAYLDIMDKMQYVTIPVVGENTTILESECTENTTRIVLDIDKTKMLNLSLAFKTVPNSYSFGTDGNNYVMNEIMLSYMSDNRYFQNHKTYGKQVNVTSGSNLTKFSTPVGNSYRCDLAQVFGVGNTADNAMQMHFSQSQWEAFSLNSSGNFSEAKFCEAEMSTTAPVTTAPVTPHPHTPSEPKVSQVLVKDSKDNTTVCLLAKIGVQLRMNYNTTKTPALANIGFNLNPNETDVTGLCSGNTSVVTFYNKHDEQTVILTFSRDDKNAYLSMVQVKYNISKASYPDWNQNTTVTKHFSVDKLTELSTSLKHSYNCSDETDILVDMEDNVILRIKGVHIQAFGVEKETFSPVSQCLPDTLPSKATTGKWTISSNHTACAKYMFTATFNVTYPTLLGAQKSMVFRIGNSSSNFNGECQKEISYFWVQMEQITFAFVFNKTDMNGDQFNYHMFGVLVDYRLPSKYFPNHAYDEDNHIQLLNATLDLFSSDNSHSYKCAAASSAKLNDTLAEVQFKDVQVQPFGLEKSGGFSAADDCKTSKWSKKKITIVALISGLIALVLFAGVVFGISVYRKRKRAAEYDTLR